jgi:hypothetical protein
MDCDGVEYHNAQQVEAGIIGMKNTAKTRYILKEWLGWCTNAKVIDDSPSKDNFPTFVDHRHDQSILTNLKVLHSLFTGVEIREYTACNVDDLPDRIDLSDVTWIIPVKMDHVDRQENLQIVLDWLQTRFKTNIIVGEQGSNHFFEYVEKRGVRYMYFDMDFFHRTRMLNLMTMAAGTNIIFNHDADVVLTIEGVKETVDLLRAGHPFVYPYNGIFLRTPKQYHAIIHSLNSIESLCGMKFKGWSDDSKGGSVAFLRNQYMKYGGENENFYSHAPEDVERYRRMSLFCEIKRVGFPLFHLDHWCGQDSRHGHEYSAFNAGEWRRVKEIKNAEGMIDYMRAWRWKAEYLRQLES